MTDQQKPDLSQIPPLSPPPDAGDQPTTSSGTGPATGVETHDLSDHRAPEPRTSPETEEQLDQIRRG